MKSVAALVQRWWRRLASAIIGAGRYLRSAWRKSAPRRRKLAVGVSATFVFLAAVFEVFHLGPPEVESVWPFRDNGTDAASWAGLRVQRPVSITDERPVENLVGNRTEWVRSTLPHIDFTVRNEGTKRIAPGRVRIKLVDSDAISACELPQGGGGGIPIARSFLIDLPVLAAGKERVLYRQLHQEVLPEGAARFRVYFRSLADPFSEELFALNVSLAGEEPRQRLEIGRFLLGLPEAIPRGGSYLPEDTHSLKTAAEDHSLLSSSWCFRRNRAVIQRFLSLPGERSSSMRLPAEASLPPGWGKLADRRSAAKVVTGLLRSNDLLLGPQLALFAAQRSDKPALVQEARGRAIIELHSHIKHWLGTLPERAVLDARILRRIQPSAGAQALLDKAEAALRKRESEEGS